MDAIKHLVEWFVRYLQNRDLSLRRIQDLKIEENVVSVINKNGSYIKYVVCLELGNPQDFFSNISAVPGCELGLVTLHSKGNIASLIQHWEWASSQPGLTVLFVSPFSSGEEKWVVRPNIHARVCEKKNLSRSFASISENVSLTSASEYAKQVSTL